MAREFYSLLCLTNYFNALIDFCKGFLCCVADYSDISDKYSIPLAIFARNHKRNPCRDRYKTSDPFRTHFALPFSVYFLVQIYQKTFQRESYSDVGIFDISFYSIY